MRSHRILVSVLVVVGAMGPLCPRGDAGPIPTPNPVDIYCSDGDYLGSLKIAKYESNSFVDDDGDKFVGAGLVMEFTRADTSCNNFQWIQSIVDGKGTIGQNNGFKGPYLDPYKRDDNLPFYNTGPENQTPDIGVYKDNGPGSRFSDFPSQFSGNAGNFIKFELAFVCVGADGKTLSYLKGLTWGYKVNADGTSSIYDAAWLDAPTKGLTDPLTAWDGTLNPNGGGAPVGYNFSDECQCCPEPSSIIVGSVFVATAALWKGRRRSLRAWGVSSQATVA